MEANAWWLLAIPLFFALGWIASRLDSAQLLSETQSLPRSYFNGLNFLLAEQPDQAIKAFEEVARLDPETAELYFALGQLFRRRGEAERAIRIHKNLLKRADLPSAQREQALFELAQDFVAAGIFDHAEAAFAQLAGTRYEAQAQRELARLYEKESNWDAAIDCAQRYLATQPSAQDAALITQDLAHYCCESAALRLSQHSLSAAGHQLAAARAADPRNPRLPFLDAELAFAQGQAAQAMATLSQALESNARLTTLALQTALSGLGQQVDSNTTQTLLSWVLRAPSAAAVQLLSPILEAQGQHAALTQLLNALAQHLSQQGSASSLAGIRSLWNAAHNAPQPSNESAQWITAANTASDALIHRYDKPICSACGFKSSRHHWRCPGCGAWATLPYAV